MAITAVNTFSHDKNILRVSSYLCSGLKTWWSLVACVCVSVVVDGFWSLMVSYGVWFEFSSRLIGFYGIFFFMNKALDLYVWFVYKTVWILKLFGFLIWTNVRRDFLKGFWFENWNNSKFRWRIFINFHSKKKRNLIFITFREKIHTIINFIDFETKYIKKVLKFTFRLCWKIFFIKISQSIRSLYNYFLKLNPCEF